MRRPGNSTSRAYDLQHTFASQLLGEGTPITYVAVQLGHAKPTTTLQWYALATHRRQETRRCPGQGGPQSNR